MSRATATEPFDGAVRVAQRRDRHVDIDARAVETPEDQAPRPALAPDQGRHQFFQDRPIQVLAQHVRAVADDLCGGIAGDAGEGQVDVRHVPRTVRGQDRLGGLVNRRRETPALCRGEARILARSRAEPGHDQSHQQPGRGDVDPEHVRIVPVADGRQDEGRRDGDVRDPGNRAGIVREAPYRPPPVRDAPLEICAQRQSQPGDRVQPAGRPARCVHTPELLGVGDHVAREHEQ
jgi:hypothetical protein